MEYVFLIALHVFFAIVWAGGAITAGFFIIPSVLEAGPAGGAVMAGVVKRRFPIVMSVAATIVLLTGLRLYMMRFTPGWLATPHGMTLSFGAILGIGAFVLGIMVQKPMAERLSKLAASIAASGAPASAAQAAELTALRAKLGRIGKITAWHLLGAAFFMAMHGVMATVG
jgi:uncharacterized membrane protein